jgi:hypothetical protein
VSGGRLTHRRLGRFGRFGTENAFGVQFRHDAISTVGLYKTKARERLSTTREDEVGQTSLGLFGQSEIQWRHGSERYSGCAETRTGST